MDTVYRYFAAMYPSASVPTYILQCRHVVEKTKVSTYVTNPTPAIGLVTSHIDALDDAELAAHNGPKGVTATRNSALLVVRGDMRQLISCVQVAADSDITHAREIIESCGLNVYTRTPKAKPELSFQYTGVSGELALSCKALKVQGSYLWQMSHDQVAWLDLPQTATSVTMVTGLAPVTMVYFRFRTITSTGLSPWSTAISVIVH